MCVVMLVVAARPARAADPDPDPWWGKDKALHFGVSAGIAAGAYGAGRAIFDRRLDAALFGGGVAIGAGAAKETLDALGHGDPSWKDLTWDLAGTVVGLALALGIDLLVSHATHASDPAAPPASAPP
jgi:putative lipoprotein